MSANWLGHQHSRLESPVHRLAPGLKLALALLVIIITVLMPPHSAIWFSGIGALLALTIVLSRIPPLFLLKRLLLLSPFVLGVALVNALQPTASAGWLDVALKSSVCLLTVTLVANTTPFSKILRALQTVRVPSLLITTIALMHRYLFVLADESERRRRARASRTFTATRRVQWHTRATIIGQLFVRASERAERIYDAMCARGWK